MSLRRRAMQAAAERLEELGIDQERPVDVFGAIDSLGVWLVFQPLTSLLGVTLPAGGIMITSQRQPTIQRYTAAHELAHWTLDHNHPAFDTEADILHVGRNEREQIAQLFAAYFLMPPPLVHDTAHRHGVRATAPLSAVQAYLIARDMRVSYEAALRQMTQLKIITDRHRDALLDTTPLSIKKQLAHGHRPHEGKAEVWPLSEASWDNNIQVTVDDEIVIGLPENQTTGYSWLDDTANAQRSTRRARPAPPAFAPPSSPPAIPPTSVPAPGRTAADVIAALSLLPPEPSDFGDPSIQVQDHPSPSDELLVVSDQYQPGWADIDPRRTARLRRGIAGAELPMPSAGDTPDPTKSGIGATGRRWLSLRANAEGQHTYVLHYAPADDPNTPPAATFTVRAVVEPPLEVQRRRLLLQIDDDVTDENDSGPVTGRGSGEADQ